MYGGFHDKDKLILLSEKMQVCISQIKCNDCAVGVMHLLWWLAVWVFLVGVKDLPRDVLHKRCYTTRLEWF